MHKTIFLFKSDRRYLVSIRLALWVLYFITECRRKQKIRETHLGKKASQETRDKMSKSHIGRPGTYGMLGKSHTEEAKQKLRENEGNKLGGAKSAKNTNSQRWMCTETGFVSTSGPLSRYQRKRGIDTSKRQRIS